MLQGSCRICGESNRTTAHHLIPLRWFRFRPGRIGRNSQLNVVPLCAICHRVVDGHISGSIANRKARQLWARAQLRAQLSDLEISYVTSLRGLNWLNATYPEVVITHDKSKLSRL